MVMRMGPNNAEHIVWANMVSFFSLSCFISTDFYIRGWSGARLSMMMRTGPNNAGCATWAITGTVHFHYHISFIFFYY